MITLICIDDMFSSHAIILEYQWNVASYEINRILISFSSEFFSFICLLLRVLAVYRLLSWVSLEDMGCRPPFSLSLLARYVS